MKMRQAKKEDNYTNLVLAAAEAVFKTYQITPIETVVDFLTKNKNNKYSYQNTIVLEKNHKIIGILIGYDAVKEQFLAENQTIQIKQNFNKQVVIEANEALKNTFYIDTIAIDEKYQRQGLGQKLIEEVIKTQTAVSLICEINNQKAFDLYQKLGFKVVNKTHLFNNQYYKMVYIKGANNE